jgi:hypothetical protein
MGQTIDRTFRISDGLASMAHKRIKSFVMELEKEGVMTKAESQAAIKRLAQAKNNLYDAMSNEFKRVLSSATTSSRRATLKVRAKVKNKSRRTKK